MDAMDVMVRAVITIKPDDTVAKAVDLFADWKRCTSGHIRRCAA
jgi:CBS domain-containing protein